MNNLKAVSVSLEKLGLSFEHVKSFCLEASNIIMKDLNIEDKHISINILDGFLDKENQEKYLKDKKVVYTDMEGSTVEGNCDSSLFPQLICINISIPSCTMFHFNQLHLLSRIYRTLAHELRHAWQKYSFFKSDNTKPYKYRPEEIDARQYSYRNIINNEVRFRKLIAKYQNKYEPIPFSISFKNIVNRLLRKEIEPAFFGWGFNIFEEVESETLRENLEEEIKTYGEMK